MSWTGLCEAKQLSNGLGGGRRAADGGERWKEGAAATGGLVITKISRDRPVAELLLLCSRLSDDGRHETKRYDIGPSPIVARLSTAASRDDQKQIVRYRATLQYHRCCQFQLQIVRIAIEAAACMGAAAGRAKCGSSSAETEKEKKNNSSPIRATRLGSQSASTASATL